MVWCDREGGDSGEGEGGRGRKGEGREGEDVVFVLGQSFSYMGALFLYVGRHGRSWALGAMSSSCDGGRGRRCCVVWSWHGGLAVVVLGHHHSRCWALVGVSGWWCWGLVAIHQWWNWVLIAIRW